MKPVEEKESKFSKMNLSQSPQTLPFSMADIQQANILTKYTTFRGKFYKQSVKTSTHNSSNQVKIFSKVIKKIIFNRLCDFNVMCRVMSVSC